DAVTPDPKPEASQKLEEKASSPATQTSASQLRPPSTAPATLNKPAPQTLATEAAKKTTQEEANPATVPDPSAIVDLLHLPVQMADVDPGGPPSEIGAKLSPAEIAEFKGALKKCWAAPSGIADANELQAVVRVALAPDGRLSAKPSL